MLRHINILDQLRDSQSKTDAQAELRSLQHRLPCIPDGPERKKVRKRIRRLQLWLNAPITERRVSAALTAMGLRFITQKPIWLKNKTQRFIDFYFPTPDRIVLELDGTSHTAAGNAAWDRDVQSRLRHVRIVRLTNQSVAQCENEEELIALLRQVLLPLFTATHPRFIRRKTSVLSGSNVLAHREMVIVTERG